MVAASSFSSRALMLATEISDSEPASIAAAINAKNANGALTAQPLCVQCIFAFVYSGPMEIQPSKGGSSLKNEPKQMQMIPFEKFYLTGASGRTAACAVPPHRR